MGRGYVVGSGWWCDGSGEHQGSQQKNSQSTSFIRDRDFFRLWYAFADHYTKAEKFVIVDSASPVQPPLPDDDRIEILRLSQNFGHATASEPRGVMSGVEHCYLSLAAYTYENELDLVYIEQDCLVRGEGWVDHAFERLSGGKLMYGSGKGTPQPMQQSVLLVRHEFLPTMIHRITTAWERRLRHRWFDPLSIGLLGDSPEKRWHWVFARDADHLPFAGGRMRPLDFSQQFLYAQHWNRDELERFIECEDWLDPELADLVRTGAASMTQAETANAVDGSLGTRRFARPGKASKPGFRSAARSNPMGRWES